MGTSNLAEVPPPPTPESQLGASAAQLAHEFNNLLTGILGHVEMLHSESALSPAARQELEQIRRATDRATELTRRLLALDCAQRRRPSPRISDPTGTWIPTEHVGDETILVVEDDDDVRQLVCRVLAQQGYKVLDAHDAETATALADRHPGVIHLLLADVVLPRLSGRELAARLSIHRPATKVLYVSGSSDEAVTRHRVLEPGIKFLEKPFSLDRLLRTVRQVLDPPESVRPV